MENKELPPDPSLKKSKRQCCCLCCTKKVIIATVLIILLLVIGIVLTVYFLFPREPQIWITTGDPAIKSVITKTNESSNILGITKASVNNPFVLILVLDLWLTVYSPNYIQLYATNITCKVNVLDNNNVELPNLVGYGYINNTNFRSLGNSTVPVDSVLTYNLTTPIISITKDPVINHLYQNCIRDGSPGTLQIKYDVVLDFRIISWTGLKPTVNGAKTVACPANAQKLFDGLGKLINTQLNDNLNNLVNTAATKVSGILPSEIASRVNGLLPSNVGGAVASLVPPNVGQNVASVVQNVLPTIFNV